MSTPLQLTEEQWLERVSEILSDSPQARLDAIVAAYDVAVENHMRIPTTLVAAIEAAKRA